MSRYVRPISLNVKEVTDDADVPNQAFGLNWKPGLSDIWKPRTLKPSKTPSGNDLMPVPFRSM